MMRFAEHEVVLPVVVVTELEAKRHHPELGYFARQALRLLDDLRISEGRLDRPVAVGDAGGSLRVELNHTDPSALPAGFRLGDNDSRILSVAKNLANEGCDVTIVSKDLPDARQGVGVRARGGGVPPRAGRRLRAGPAWTSSNQRRRAGPALRARSHRARGRRRAALPHRARPALAAGKRSRAGRCRQADPAGARRPGRVRAARPQRRAAHRPRPAPRPRRRHPQPRRARGHRQVGARPVRRPRVGHGAPGAAQGARLPAPSSPSAARSSATCPAPRPRR